MPFPFCHPTNNIKALKKHKVLTTKKKNQNDPLESVFHNPPIYEQWPTRLIIFLNPSRCAHPSTD